MTPTKFLKKSPLSTPETSVPKVRKKRIIKPPKMALTPQELQNARANFGEAFGIIGGVERLAMWARRNPTQFFKMYAKLINIEVTQEITHSGTIHIATGVPGPEMTIENQTIDNDTGRPIQ